MICLGVGIKICKMASDLVKKSVDYIFEAKIWLHSTAHFSVFGLLLNKKNVIMSLSCVAVITHFPVVLVISHYREKSLLCKYISLPLRRKKWVRKHKYSVYSLDLKFWFGKVMYAGIPWLT